MEYRRYNGVRTERREGGEMESIITERSFFIAENEILRNPLHIPNLTISPVLHFVSDNLSLKIF